MQIQGSFLIAGLVKMKIADSPFIGSYKIFKSETHKTLRHQKLTRYGVFIYNKKYHQNESGQQYYA